MEAKEKLILALLFLVLGVFLWVKGTEYAGKASYMRKKIKEVALKKKELEQLSNVYKRWQETRKVFYAKKGKRSFKEAVYSIAKGSGLRIISVTPKREGLLYGLQKECISLNLSGEYDRLLSFVRAVEENKDFIYIRDLRIRDKRRKPNGHMSYSISVDLCLVEVGT